MVSHWLAGAKPLPMLLVRKPLRPDMLETEAPPGVAGGVAAHALSIVTPQNVTPMLSAKVHKVTHAGRWRLCQALAAAWVRTHQDTCHSVCRHLRMVSEALSTDRLSGKQLPIIQ